MMLHEDGAAEDDVRAYLLRWSVVTPDLADHIVRFITEPTSRTYVMNYPVGYDLCSSYVGDDAARFRHLLSEQVRVGELLATPRDQGVSASP
jgi:hypothetical protein